MSPESRQYQHEGEKYAINREITLAFLSVPVPTEDNLEEMPEFDELVLRAHGVSDRKAAGINKNQFNQWKNRAKVTLQRFWSNVSDDSRYSHKRALDLLTKAAQTNPDIADIGNVRAILDHYKIEDVSEAEKWQRNQDRLKRRKGTGKTEATDPTALPQPDTNPTRLEMIDAKTFGDHLMELRRQRQDGIITTTGFIGDPKTAIGGENIPTSPLADHDSPIGRGVARWSRS